MPYALCAVESCKKKSSDHKNLTFFTFPSDPLIRKLWIKNCDLTHLLYQDTIPICYRVCADHFEDKMFLEPWTRKCLTHNAVPTLFNEVTLESPEKLTIKKEEEFETQACPSCSRPITDKKPFIIPPDDDVKTYIKIETFEASSSKISLELMSENDENMKLLKEIQTADQEIEELKKKLDIATQLLDDVNTEEQMLKLCKIHLQPSLVLFIQNYIENRGKEPKDFCYSDRILDLGRALYIICPVNVYHNLQPILQLPFPPLCALKPILKSHELHSADSDLNN